VHTGTQARFKKAYRDIADRRELLGRNKSKAKVRRLVSDWLEDDTNKRWLIVVDNADNVETFFSSWTSQRDEADASAQIPLATLIPQSRISIDLGHVLEQKARRLG
jgi:hypothetical protein